MQKSANTSHEAYFVQVPADKVNIILKSIPEMADVHIIRSGKPLWRVITGIVNEQHSLRALHIITQPTGKALKLGSILLPIHVDGCLTTALRCNCLWTDLSP